MKLFRKAGVSCSFCGKHQQVVKKLIAGPNVFICDECIGLCNDIIALEQGETVAGTFSDQAKRFARRLEHCPDADALARRAKALAEDVARWESQVLRPKTP